VPAAVRLVYLRPKSLDDVRVHAKRS
jgi:hypothetical protein